MSTLSGNTYRVDTSPAAMAGAAFGRATLVAGGTIVFLGGATVLVSGFTMSIAKVVMDRSQVCSPERRHPGAFGIL